MSRAQVRPAARVSRLILAVVLVGAVLTGCAGIPREGSVRAGQADIIDESPLQVFLPSGPQRDASIQSILLGFIDAASSPEGNYAIAREFLTTGFSATWEPTAGVTVDSGTGRTATDVDAQTMQVTVIPVAEVSAAGEYREVDSAPVPLTYQFVQVEGQWRISSAPNGTVVDETTFNDVFSASSLYFFDPGFRTLVPDRRWFPRGASAPTKIVNAVLGGPSPWLVGAVVTAFPEGTALTADTVQVVGRSAMVDLNNEALNADRITLERMKAQLTSSLPAGMSVQISIDQNPQGIEDLTSAELAVNPRVDARALVLRNGELGFLAASGQSLTPIGGISDGVVGLNPSAITLGSGQRSAAVLAGSGVYVVRAGDAPVLLDQRPRLIAPSIDVEGFVWSVPADQPGAVLVFGSTSQAIAVPTPWPEATAIQSLKVSRDGTRLAVAFTIGPESRLVVVGIIRKDGVPVGLGPPMQIAADIGVPLDVAWIDEMTVASLSAQPTGTREIVAREIGGVSTTLESPPAGAALAGSNSLRDLRALTTGGGLQVQRGVGWQQRLDGVRVLATQQGINQ